MKDNLIAALFGASCGIIAGLVAYHIFPEWCVVAGIAVSILGSIFMNRILRVMQS